MPRNIPYSLYVCGNHSKTLNESRGEKRTHPEEERDVTLSPPEVGVTPHSPKQARNEETGRSSFMQVALICLILGAVLFGLAWCVPG